MKIRHFFFLVILSLSATCAIAQDQRKVSFAVLGGINFQNLNGKTFSGDKLENEMILGYHGGINLQMRLVPEFYFQPGLLYSTKGGKNINNLYTSKYKLSYIEMPLNFVYKGLLGNGYVMVGFGPYIGYGITGEVITESSIGDINSDIVFQNTVEIGDPITANYFKAFDAGGNVFIAYETAVGLFIQMNSQLGMLKINPDDKRFSDDKSIIKNTGFGFSLGYRF